MRRRRVLGADLSPALARVRRASFSRPSAGRHARRADQYRCDRPARGRGVALAMAARSFLAMARRKMRFAGYTLVLDDNWLRAARR